MYKFNLKSIFLISISNKHTSFELKNALIIFVQSIIDVNYFFLTIYSPLLWNDRFVCNILWLWIGFETPNLKIFEPFIRNFDGPEIFILLFQNFGHLFELLTICIFKLESKQYILVISVFLAWSPHLRYASPCKALNFIYLFNIVIHRY